MATLESLEARLNLIGELVSESYSSNSSETTLTYKNITPYKLRLQLWSSVSYELEDNDASYEDLHWRDDVTITVTNSEGGQISTETKTVGYAGSNNKQYDHKTWDTVSALEYVYIEPGHSVDFKTSVIIETGGSGHDEWTKTIDAKIFIVGALE